MIGGTMRDGIATAQSVTHYRKSMYINQTTASGSLKASGLERCQEYHVELECMDILPMTVNI